MRTKYIQRLSTRGRLKEIQKKDGRLIEEQRVFVLEIVNRTALPDVGVHTTPGQS